MVLLAALGLSVVLVACGDDDDDEGGATTATSTQAPAQTAAGSTATVEATDADSSDGDVVAAIDACALLTKDEVEAALGTTISDPVPDESPPPFFGCVYDAPSGERVTLLIIAYDDAAEATDAFEFAVDLNEYPEIEGLGDRAYNAQPIDDVTVLSGSYELTVGLYFVSDDDQMELDLAIELAGMALERLP